MSDQPPTTPSQAGIDRLAQCVWPGSETARRVTLIGASKNAGKTTALLALAAAAGARGWSVGLVSIGVDGEARDAWLDFAKPRIVVERGAWVVTAAAWIAAGGRAFAAARDLGFATALGPTALAQVRARGAVQLGGIANRTQLRQAVQQLHAHAQVVLIDGAYHRQAAAHPEVADAVVVAVGALAGPTTQAAIAASMPTLRALLAPKTAASDPAQAVQVAGALSDAVAAAHPTAVALVARDPSRVLLSAAGWLALDRRQARVAVQRAVPVAAVVVNPFRPDGRSEDPRAFGTAVAAALADEAVPVVDVVTGLAWRAGQELAPGDPGSTIAVAARVAARDRDA